MITTSTQQNSETALMDQLYKLADAGGSVVQVRTREAVRTALTLRKHLIGSDTPYYEWDIVNGWRTFTKENFLDHQVTGNQMDFPDAIQRPLTDLRTAASEVRKNSAQVHFFVYVDPHPYMNGNPFCAELLQQYAAILPSTNVCVVMVTDDNALPGVTAGNVLVCDMPTPSADELKAVLIRIVEDGLKDEKSFPDGSDLTDEDVTQIAHLGLGLTLYEFETYTAISIIDGSNAKETSILPSRLMEGIGKGKTAVIRQSEILELMHTESISDVGGMQRLKDWIDMRKGSYSDEAKEFGVEAPKGIALVGVPGTGKSLTAKAVASVLGVPLVRLDFARVFSKYVGDSESRMLSALKMVEAMAPCVLFADEIDKGLGGAGGAGDSGTSSRVLGTYLTWLNDTKAPIFNMVTANRVDGLPPELLRKGRFDAIFSVSMPDHVSRREVLAIHLRKRGRDITSFTEKELAEFDKASAEYVPAEIEAGVKDGITAAFNDPDADILEMRHIVAALREMVPMSKSNAAHIARIVEWAANNATPVEYTDALPDPRTKSEAQKPTGRIIRTRR